MKWNTDISFIRHWISAIAMLGLGIAMVVNPHLLNGASAQGRRQLIKTITIAVWGYPVGAVLILLGTYWIYTEIRSIVDARQR